jgi:rhodanese-related sulfurtransferase
MFNPFAKLPALSPEEVVQRIQEEKNVAFIDVRSSTEYDGGHAEGAKNIPLNTLINQAEELSKYDDVYVICQSGGRSSQAVQFLVSNGIHAVNVSGGTNAWQSAGLPIE